MFRRLLWLGVTLMMSLLVFGAARLLPPPLRVLPATQSHVLFVGSQPPGQSRSYNPQPYPEWIGG
ncbi:hypothetical protein [Tengunoibacter tsumagoiensis]|uniref:Uncharacterized protein n=1 Tax=Tengunoibacter tsumagoiensis TaxID=2014871 RepID=A0A402A7U3_9CHLR|nr:hypothetical protein [Tengunoibacter tsumagoiensis]GCE15051.1 hypothetical protein KTT_49100 [Tengunoibacter tsumagoiensis]